MPVTMTAVTHSRATAADGTVTCSFSSSTPRRCPTPPDPSLKRYRALAVGMIREAREMDSRQLGYLVAGEEIAALATETVGDHLRVQFRRGWASVFWQGKQMLELLPDAQQRSASPAPADDSGLRIPLVLVPSSRLPAASDADPTVGQPAQLPPLPLPPTSKSLLFQKIVKPNCPPARSCSRPSCPASPSSAICLFVCF